MLTDMPPLPAPVTYPAAITSTRKLYYRGLLVQSTSAVRVRAPIAVSSASRESTKSEASDLATMNRQARTDRTDRREALLGAACNALIATPVLGLLSLVPSLGGLSYAAIASMIIAGLAGLAASES